MIPLEVYEELRHPGAPREVRQWIATPPEWLEVKAFQTAWDPLLEDLDKGEAAAILLASEQEGAVFLLMDDAKGRKEAARRGLPTTGTPGVPRAASRKGYLRLSEVLPRLLETSFYIGPMLIESLLAEERTRS